MCQFKVLTLQHSRGLEKQHIHKVCVKMACSLVLFCILLSITSGKYIFYICVFQVNKEEFVFNRLFRKRFNIYKL